MSSRRSRFLLGLLLGVSLLFAVSKFIDVDTAAEKLNDFPASQLAVVLFLGLIYYLLKALRWHYLLRCLDIKLPWRRSLLLYVSGQWFAITPAGEFVRAYLLTRYGYSFSRGSAAVTAQVVFDFLSLALVGSIAVIWFGQLAFAILPFTAALIAVVLLFVYGPSLLPWKTPQHFGRLAAHVKRWSQFYRDSRQLLLWRSMLVCLSLAIPAVLIGSLILFEVCIGYQISAVPGQTAYIYSLSQLAGALSMLPHGLGAIEGTSLGLFYYAGVDTTYAAAAIILFRLATVGWGLVLGGIALLVLRTPLAGSFVPKVE